MSTKKFLQTSYMDICFKSGSIENTLARIIIRSWCIYFTHRMTKMNEMKRWPCGTRTSQR